MVVVAGEVEGCVACVIIDVMLLSKVDHNLFLTLTKCCSCQILTMT